MIRVSSPWLRGALAGVAGGIAWLLGIFLIFGPAQPILTDPDLQSSKMLGAFTSSNARSHRLCANRSTLVLATSVTRFRPNCLA